MNGRALALVAAIGIAAGAAGGFIGARLGGGERVRTYLLAHPDTISAAMQVLHDRELAKVVAANRAAIVTPYPGAVTGNSAGRISLVEYTDYNCSFCRASVPTLDALARTNPDLRIVYRELPVLAKSSREAAFASLAAARQGRYGAFRQALYAAGRVSKATIGATVKATGVALIAPVDAEAEFTRNFQTANELGFTGTPGFVIGDRVLQGIQSAAVLQAAIDATRGSAPPRPA